MELLDNVVQPYAWGSRAAIASLRGQPPSAEPQAELWMGAHPSAPSRSLRDGTSLLARIESAPERELGSDTVRTYGPRLPFLLKVLAAEQPLSLQAHPTLEQARAGFDAEEAAGVPLRAAHRNYKDRNHKPELLCALGPFVALCGFRAIDETRELLATLSVPGLSELSRRLDDDLRAAFGWLMTLDPARRATLTSETALACGRVRDRGGRFHDECAWGARLAELHPGDAGVIGALLLNLVHLSAGEAIYLPAGNLHAYLHGVGVEIMASSDNVLRGGMTPKHVDVDELLRVLDFAAGPVEKVLPERVPLGRGEAEVWRTPAREFELSRVTLDGDRSDAELAVGAPLLALCTEGSVLARDDEGEATLGRGDSAFVRGSSTTLSLRGEGVVFLATSRS